jgi:hypothetical protein
MKEALLSLLQLSLRAAIIAAKNRSGSLQVSIQLIEAVGPRQWLAVLAAPIIAWARTVASLTRSTPAMAHLCTSGSDSTNIFKPTKDATLDCEISDEALERASGIYFGVPTLVGTYCFTCPVANPHDADAPARYDGMLGSSSALTAVS